MHISRRTGGGRGVYEVAGRTHDNLSASDIRDHEFVISLKPYVLLKTGLQLNIQGGKPRLVIKESVREHRVVQIQRQIAVVLLLPKPIRADSGMGKRSYVIHQDEYVVERLGIQRSILSEHDFEFVPNSLLLQNSVQSVTFGFLARFAKVVTLWESEDVFPAAIHLRIAQHKKTILSGAPINIDAEKNVKNLYQECAEYAKATIMSTYTEGADLFQLLDTISPTYITPTATDEPLPEEIDTSIVRYEGAKRQVIVNAYERNSSARKQCVAYYGYSCAVCKINFEALYGEIGQNFIHVHHLKPLSEVQDTYQVDPILDLRPVCPNCHAMLHKNSPPFSIEELRNIMDEVAVQLKSENNP